MSRDKFLQDPSQPLRACLSGPSRWGCTWLHSTKAPGTRVPQHTEHRHQPPKLCLVSLCLLHSWGSASQHNFLTGARAEKWGWGRPVPACGCLCHLHGGCCGPTSSHSSLSCKQQLQKASQLAGRGSPFVALRGKVGNEPPNPSPGTGDSGKGPGACLGVCVWETRGTMEMERDSLEARELSGDPPLQSLGLTVG